MPQNTPEYEIKYIELKSGYHDDGPAWIGRVKKQKRKDLLLQQQGPSKHVGNYANHIDVETREGYWISGIKKDGHDRHWAGKGKVTIDRKMIPEYLSITGEKELDPQRFIIADIEDCFPEERIHTVLNKKWVTRYRADEG